jgi:RpiB/LacA/LacB family sugar-phosphate isomerase
MNIPFIDCGCYSLADCDYKDYIAQAMETKQYFPGTLIIGFCRSGQGVNICANKYKDIRAALITTAPAASLAIRHNAANFFSIAASVDVAEMQGIVNTLLIEKFEGGRHQNRLSGQK